MSKPTETWYLRALAEDVLDTVNKGYELDASNIVASLHSAADQIDSLNKDVYAARTKIKYAPHDFNCPRNWQMEECDCWKELL